MGPQAGQEPPANTGEEAPQPDRLGSEDLPPQDGEAGDVKGGATGEHFPKRTLS